MDVLADWKRTKREGRISAHLAASLAVVECVTTGSPNDLQAAVSAATDAGVSPPALRSAGYINFGFNAINRIADALGVTLPDAPDLRRSSTILLSVGYRPLSGELFSLIRSERTGPPEQLLDELRRTALSGPAVLPASVRASLFDATASGPLAAFARQVADRAWTITEVDVRTLMGAGYVEDEVFETVICAALGEATRRFNLLVEAIEGLAFAGDASSVESCR